MKTARWEDIVALARSIDCAVATRDGDSIRLAELLIDFDRNVVKKPIRDDRVGRAPASDATSRGPNVEKKHAA